MSTIFEELQQHSERLDLELAKRGFLQPQAAEVAWTTKTYKSAYFRRANLDVVKSKSLWMMHLCIFPHTHNPAPIFGFDIIAGQQKVTGAFLDFSPVAKHPLIDWFAERVSAVQLNKARDLPQWAKNIFSPYIIAAGNIQTSEELCSILELSLDCLQHYLQNLKQTGDYIDLVQQSYAVQQNYYCQQQKQNPHTPKVLKALGFSDNMITDFINHELFPELKD